MRRLALALAAVLSLGCAGAFAATLNPREVRLRHFVCKRALDPASRAVSITAVMHSIKGTTRLSLRFQLLSRTHRKAPYTTVTGGDLGSWISPIDPTLGQRPNDVWILNKQVVDLAAPAVYRFRVFFRWIGAHDHILASTVRETTTCRQPELRPDLAVEGIAVSPDNADPTLDRYVATIGNNGATAAGPFSVVFAPRRGAAPLRTRSLNGLGPHAKTKVTFTGPICSSGSPPTVTVDPNDQVDDYNRANNSATAVCPPASGT